MRNVLVGAVMLAVGVSAGIPAAEARPGGCLKYGAAGAIAGKLAGDHTWKGAAAGCALGYLRRRQYDQAERRRLRDRDGCARDFDTNGRRGRLDADETGAIGRRYNPDAVGPYGRPPRGSID